MKHQKGRKAIKEKSERMEQKQQKIQREGMGVQRYLSKGRKGQNRHQNVKVELKDMYLRN